MRQLKGQHCWLTPLVAPLLFPFVTWFAFTTGRRPLFLLAAVTDAITNTMCALVPNNYVYLCMLILQVG